MKKFLSLLLAAVMLFSLVACGNDDAEKGNPVNSGDNKPGGNVPQGEVDASAITEFDPDATYTYRAALSSLPSNWNPHDYEDAASSDIMTYLQDSLYGFAFNDELHPLDDPDRTPYDGYIIIPYMAVGDPVDVTEEVKAEHPDWIPESATSGYAYEVKLRDDLYFDTGYHITAETFVQGMKYLLMPELQNYRATDIYAGSSGIVGAEAYFNSGSYALGEFVSADYGDDEYVDPADFTLSDDGICQVDGKDVVLDLTSGGNWGSNGLNAYYAAYAEAMPEFAAAVDPLKAAANEKGWVYLTPELVKNVQDAIAVLQGFENVEEYAAASGDYAYIEFEEMAFLGQTYPEVTYEDTVGYYAKDEYTLVQVFKSAIAGFDLYYGGLQDSLVLVEPDVYASCLHQDELGNWYSDYMTSVETSPSYGPYSMDSYQTEKAVHYTKNTSYYGYHDNENNVYKDPTDGNIYRLYQTTDVDLQVIGEYSTQKQMFLAGELMTYPLQPDDYDQYGFSDYSYASPSASIFFLILTGDMGGLQAREAAADFDQTKNDLETITLDSFRKAFAISFDKQAFCDEVHPAYTPGYGIFGSQIIYDPETAGMYRNTDEAKQVLCDFYSVDVSDFDSLDDAVNSITGYDPITAKELYKQAFDEAIAAGYITDNDGDGKSDQTIELVYASPGPADYITSRIKFMNDHIVDVTKDTPFEGKITFVESAPLGDSGWADAVKHGNADFCIAGWSGSAMNPYNLLTAYTWDNYAYAATWYHPKQDMMTLTINGEEITMSVYDWTEAVNGTMVTVNGKDYNFGSNDAEPKTRLQILAAVEGALLQSYSYMPLTNAGSKILLSQQVYYVIEDYNPVMGRGGMAYMKYNYSDAEWAEYVSEQVSAHGQLQY